jgi:hypothetical protein
MITGGHNNDQEGDPEMKQAFLSRRPAAGRCRKAYDERLFISPDNSALVEIVWGQFQCHFVAGQDTDKVHSQLAADMSQYHMLVLKFDTEHRVRKFFEHDAFYFNYICF